ncbi:MAG: glycosyltransferase family 2 protein [Candidatus Anammoximicrobium sp.]|nr:glycosyltransferase family 2 protein [Candidatus Anammoximicrobium sp.]
MATAESRGVDDVPAGPLGESAPVAAPSESESAAPGPWPPGFKLSVVVPVYNEQQTVAEILARVRAVPIPKEIVVVDDHSTDDTLAVLRQLADWPELRVICKPQNEGKGAALRTGFAAATGDVVVVQDADLEYDPNDLPSLLGPILRGEADVVYGSRYLREEPQDPSFLHRLGNRLLTWASNLFTGLRLTDMETCYKMIPRPLLQSLDIRQNRFGFEPEVTAKLARRGVRIKELPVRYQGRGYKEGKKIGWRDGVNAFYCIVRYRWRD